MVQEIEALLTAGRTGASGPFPRTEVDGAVWQHAIDRLSAGDFVLFGLWGEVRHVHMAVIDEQGAPGILTLACADGGFPSIGARHPPAIVVREDVGPDEAADVEVVREDVVDLVLGVRGGIGRAVDLGGIDCLVLGRAVLGWAVLVDHGVTVD